MKNLKTFFALFILASSLISCDAVDDLTEIEVDTEISEDFTIVVTEGETFSESLSVSIDDENVQDNLDKIENIEIESLTYQIISVSGTENVTATGEFSIASSSFPWFSYSESDFVNLTAAAEAGTVYEIEVDEDVISAFEADLRSGATASILATGTVSASPVTFVVRVKAKVNVVVDAI